MNKTRLLRASQDLNTPQQRIIVAAIFLRIYEPSSTKPDLAIHSLFINSYLGTTVVNNRVLILRFVRITAMMAQSLENCCLLRDVEHFIGESGLWRDHWREWHQI